MSPPRDATGAHPLARSGSRAAIVVLTNVVLTVLTAAVVGPSVEKLDRLFGLVAWAARAPFYLVPLYLAPFVLWARPGVTAGVVAGLAAGIPLTLWALATRCTPAVQAAYLVSGALQGAVLSHLARRG